MPRRPTRPLPSGQVTFLFTDIEGSTRLLGELGDRYDDVLDRHNEVLRAAWAANDGAEINTEGDAFFVAFSSADDALRACADGQRALANATWPPDVRVRVRMGLHTGFAKPRNHDYSAIAVNRAARIAGAAHGGQVLVSSATVEAAEAEHGLESLGMWRIRDFDGPEALHRLMPRGWEATSRPPRLRPADGHNLVAPATSRVDREGDIQWLCEAVGPGVLASVVGPGGVGKTRLATEVGLEVVTQWPDGVWMVELDGVRADDLVPDAVADALGASQVPGQPSTSDVVQHLEGRRALVILDNCEQVTRGAAMLVAEILRSCPGVGICATSRIPLGLRMERIHRLATLDAVETHDPAVTLFVDRAGQRAEQDLPVVRELCQQLDGLPLAIELAAARCASMPPSLMLASLRQTMDVLESRDQTLPDRHRSLDNVLDWSRQLLEPTTQAVLRRLAVLGHSFDLDLAMVACADDDLEREHVPAQVWILIDHSLVAVDAGAGASRFRLPVTVRSWAASLRTVEEGRAAVDRLAGFYLERLGPHRAVDRAWLSEMRVELANLRGLVRDLADHDQPAAQALAWSIGRFHELAGAYATAVTEVGQFVQELTKPGPNRVALLTLLADAHLRMGSLLSADAVLAQVPVGDDVVDSAAWDETGVLRSRGEAALRGRDYDRAISLAGQALEVATTARGRARALSLLGLAQAGVGNNEAALEAFTKELEAAASAGMETFLAKTYGNLAEMHLQLGNVGAAAAQQLACLDTARSTGEDALVAFSVMIAARLLAGDGEHAEAVRLHQGALRALTAIGYELYASDVQVSEEFLVAARRALGEDDFAAAVQASEGLDLVQAAQVAEVVLNAHAVGGGVDHDR